MDSESSNYPPGRTFPRHHLLPRVADGPETSAPHVHEHWRVNLAEPWEITFWTRQFGCSESQLQDAVREVGDRAGAVRAHLLDEDQQPRN